MSGSFESVHVCSDETSVYTLIRKSFLGMESEPMLTLKEKFTLPEAQRRFEPITVHHAEQRAQHTTN